MIDIVTKAAAGAGGIVALARHLKISHNAMYSWKRVPAERVIEIERVSGISRHELRPDLFGPAASEQETAA
ncbi:helix-turn-helix domain-containing protein [Mesorhizobium sp. RP14(2022)]|uniref:Helix-turn-helix domain-containing protein n=1 Tax=Mesorhizobium liriopis TaxID=2953882 RepID=A0ABT1C7R3_9HYPH|nr:Cro/CI family transcriptional regulator [Mesorhizobium liriopis]MCO6050877.1 helix-turn-helix domain-containing protein [Mesorhizobium liriopis]